MIGTGEEYGFAVIESLFSGGKDKSSKVGHSIM